MRYLSIKNYDKHQHYKDRRPPWIKLHVEILDDYAFTCLQDASKAHLMLLWVLASKLENRIPYDLVFLSKKLGSTSPIDVEELVLQGFIEVSQDDSAPLASRKQSAMPETEAETEAETYTKRAPRRGEDPRFALAWSQYPRRTPSSNRAEALKAWSARVASGVDPAVILAGVERYAACVRAMGREGTEYVKQASTFFGPNAHYLEPWDAPVVKTVESGPRVLRATEMLIT